MEKRILNDKSLNFRVHGAQVNDMVQALERSYPHAVKESQMKEVGIGVFEHL